MAPSRTLMLEPGPSAGAGALRTIRRGVRRICDRLAWALVESGRSIYRSPQEIRVEAWRAVDGDQKLRLEYDLDEESVVVDVGGYHGQWASDIYARYNCRIHCFEPVRLFSERISSRFARNSKISVYPFGLAAQDSTALISHQEDASSIYVGEPDEKIELREAIDVFDSLGLHTIDLIKINIEGGEYGLLEHLIDRNIIHRICDIQVQFHDFVPDARSRMNAIHLALRETHETTYQHEFVWENWRLKAV